jgi:peptidoglycan hydrolase-like protein with peptidoglycan-binding domain
MIVSRPEEYIMAAGPLRDERARRPVRLAVTLVIASGLTLTGACTGPLTPAPAPPAAGAPAPAPPPNGTTAPTTAPGTSAPTSAPATSAPPGAPQAAPPTSPAPEAADEMLRVGASGPAVLELQQRLSDLGFWLGSTDGNYGQLTRQAVMAFQKAENVTRDGVAGPQTRQRLPNASRPQPRTAEGDRIEVDLERQLLLVVRGGQVQWAFNTSTGNGEAYDRPSGGTGVARTPRGNFEIERQINGVRNAELGVLYRPKYFRGGIAVHGSGSIPAQPASHGCVRVSNAAMDLLWSSGVAPVGTEVTVY